MKSIKIRGTSEVVFPTKIVCLVKNYRKHAEEMGGNLPEKPIIFLKPNSSITGHGEMVIYPKYSVN